jgi:hypothetical protein
MSFTRKSVPKPPAGSGSPSPKNGLMTFIYVDDILSEPTRDQNGVLQLGNYVMKTNAKMYQFYATPSTQKMNITIEGDEDLGGFINKVEAMHPGNELDMMEFVQNSLDRGFIIIGGAGCGNATNRSFGSVCNPMKFKGEVVDDKDGAKTNLVFEQSYRDRKVPGFYQGTFSFAVNAIAPDASLDLLVASGTTYELPSFATTDDITVSSIDLAHGTVVSLIGGGGDDPATLSKGTQGAVTVLLKDGTQWVALDKSVINLQVFKDDTTTYLSEISRT